MLTSDDRHGNYRSFNEIISRPAEPIVFDYIYEGDARVVIQPIPHEEIKSRRESNVLTLDQ